MIENLSHGAVIGTVFMLRGKVFIDGSGRLPRRSSHESLNPGGDSVGERVLGRSHGDANSRRIRALLDGAIRE